MEGADKRDTHWFPGSMAGALWASPFLCHTMATMSIHGDRKVRVMGTGARMLCFPGSTNGTNCSYIDNERDIWYIIITLHYCITGIEQDYIIID